MLQHNCNSAAAFPLTDSGSTIGTFVVYAGDEGFFHEQELNLLDEAAGDISYSLTKIKVEEDRKKNEEALRERVEELERHQQASVQREFRIKELKEELETLKGESSNK